VNAKIHAHPQPAAKVVSVPKANVVQFQRAVAR
jgi:hypothetical protein